MNGIFTNLTPMWTCSSFVDKTKNSLLCNSLVTAWSIWHLKSSSFKHGNCTVNILFTNNGKNLKFWAQNEFKMIYWCIWCLHFLLQNIRNSWQHLSFSRSDVFLPMSKAAFVYPRRRFRADLFSWRSQLWAEVLEYWNVTL